MTAVFRQKDPVAVVDSDWIAKVKEHAAAEPLGRSRLNMHHDESDQVQEMLIAFRGDSLVSPHRHRGKSESIHVMEGRALIVFFDDEGRMTRQLTIGAAGTGLPVLYRMASEDWHVVIPLEKSLVVHETSTGPFVRNTDPPPSWAPQDEKELRAFIANVRESSVVPEIEVVDGTKFEGQRRQAVAELKALHWSHPVDSQLAWMKDHLSGEDAHVLARTSDRLVGYLRIPRLTAIVDGKPRRVWGVSTVVVHPSWRGLGMGQRLLNAFADALAKDAIGLLQCNDRLARWYAQAGWKVFSGTAECRNGATTSGFCRDDMMMVLNAPPGMRQIVLDGEPF